MVVIMVASGPRMIVMAVKMVAYRSSDDSVMTVIMVTSLPR